ncbi:MAG: TonB-dependent receptor [Deltaproteobacteria bacterium]
MNRNLVRKALAGALLVTLLEHNLSSLAFAQQPPSTPAPSAELENEPKTAANPGAPGATTAAPAEGGDLGDLASLLAEPVVTTASRSAERASTAPSTVYSITAAELQTFGIRTIDEALGFLGLGVYTASPRDYFGGIDVGAQGVLLRDRGRHMLGLLNGHVMNSQVHGAVSINEAFGVPLEAIDHIEVMLGAGSVMYGSNAMLLVVNIVTRHARDLRGVHLIGELGVAAPHEGKNLIGEGRYGLRYRTGASGAATFGEQTELMIALEWLEDRSSAYGIGPSVTTAGAISFRPGETEWGGQAHHRMIAPSGLLSARYRDFRLLMQANHYEREMPLVGTFQDPDALETQDALRLDLRHSIDLGALATLGSRLYADYQRFSENSSWIESYTCLPGQDNGCRLQSSANARWLGLEEQLSLDWLLDGTVSTMVGFDLRGRSTESRSADSRDLVNGTFSDAVPTPHSERTGVLGAVFAQQLWKPTKWLTLNVGARVDADTDFAAHLSPRVAVTVEPADGTSIRASYSEAFRGPTPYELDELDPTFRLAPVSLKPELVRAVELEWRQRLGFASFSLRGFASFYRDFIDSRSATAEEFAAAAATQSPTVDGSIAVVNDNVSSLRAIGASPSVVLRPARGLEMGGSFNYSHARRDGAPLLIMPPVFGNARIAWQPVPEGVTIAAAAIVAGKRKVTFGPFPADIEIGEQLDLRTTVSGPTGLSGLQFRASLTYVLNRSLPYTVAAPGTGAPGEGPLLIPVASQLYGFVGLQYDLSP